MKNSSKKLLILATIMISYFATSYDVASLPFKSNTGSSYSIRYSDGYSKEETEVFHSKIFGDIPLMHRTGITLSDRGSWDTNPDAKRTSYDQLQPADGAMWIVNLILFLRIMTIVLLSFGFIFSWRFSIGANCEYDFSAWTDRDLLPFAFTGVLVGIIAFIMQLANSSSRISYGLPEVLMILLFITHCFIPERPEIRSTRS
ncbi:MAG: hypothetical protein JWM20_588 [Patescibacteria group bacterium]|nr:hypothetical protein [Patescibacteria group bacterium]